MGRIIQKQQVCIYNHINNQRQITGQTELRANTGIFIGYLQGHACTTFVIFCLAIPANRKHVAA